jgi:hypothetical protein
MQQEQAKDDALCALEVSSWIHGKFCEAVSVRNSLWHFI